MGDLNDDVRNVDTFSALGLQEVVSSKFRQPPPLHTTGAHNSPNQLTEYGYHQRFK